MRIFIFSYKKKDRTDTHASLSPHLLSRELKYMYIYSNFCLFLLFIFQVFIDILDIYHAQDNRYVYYDNIIIYSIITYTLLFIVVYYL